MFLRVICATASLCLSSQAMPQTTIPDHEITRVVCRVGTGGRAGTMFRVGPRLAISAQHVTGSPNCISDGEAIDGHRDFDRDLSIIPLQHEGPHLTVDCGGFIEGRHYISYGYARAAPFLTRVDLIGTGRKANGFSLLWSIVTLIPGMSGGPITDAETGKVVGINNNADWASGISGSIAFKDTSICKS